MTPSLLASTGQPIAVWRDWTFMFILSQIPREISTLRMAKPFLVNTTIIFQAIQPISNCIRFECYLIRVGDFSRTNESCITLSNHVENFLVGDPLLLFFFEIISDTHCLPTEDLPNHSCNYSNAEDDTKEDHE